MKVNGFQLREAVRRWELIRENAAKQFPGTHWAFEGEKDRLHPDMVMERYIEADVALAKLQTAQQQYNLDVKLDVSGVHMSLSEAVKRLGAAGRAEKMWRVALNDEGQDRYSSQRNITRNKDEERAKKVMKPDALLERANKASKFAGALRAAIAKGNVTEVDLPVDPALLG